MQAFADRLRPQGDVTERLVQAILVALAVVFLLVKLPLLSSININWDEYLFLSRVHELNRGELASAFQTFHVHLFQWLTAVPGNEVDQVLAARYTIYALRVASTILVFLLGVRVAGRTGGLVAALASLTFSHMLRHGESFRADPLVAFLVLLAAALLVWRFQSAIAVTVAGVALALASSITIKTAIYVPAIAALLAIMYWSGDAAVRPVRARRAILFAAVTVAAYAAMSLLHAAVTPTAGTEVARRAIASGGGMLGNARFDVLARTLRADWPFWLLFAAGVGFAVHDAVRGRDARRARALMLCALLVPLGSLLIYRNTFEYFYVALVPFASTGCGYAVARIAERLGRGLRAAAPLLLAAPMVWQGGAHAWALRWDRITPQREVIEAVHAIFPEPVPYLDRCGMIASFPRAPLFMSTYVLAAYRRAGVPRVAEMVAEGQHRFLLANVSGLRLERSWDTVRTYERRLLREDFEFLQKNFVPHSGPIWVVGKRLDLPAGVDTSITTVVRGPYTLESSGPVIVDGVTVRPDAVIELEPGAHRIRGAGRVTLRYGAHLPVPRVNGSSGQLFDPL